MYRLMMIHILHNLLKFSNRRLLLLLLIFPSGLFAQTWQSVPLVSQKILESGNSGGEGCQVVQAIEADGSDGSFLLMGTDVGGIYRSTDGGQNWNPCNVGYHPRGNCGFAIDPNNNQRALAVGGNSIANRSHGLYLTTDQGASWKHVLQINDYDGYRGFKDKISFVKSSFDSSEGGSMIAYWSSPSGGIYKTEDGGISWKKVNASYGDCLLKVHPDSGFVYVANETGFFKSVDGGVTFTLKLEAAVRDMDLVITNPDMVYVTSSNLIYKSTDGGESFSQVAASGYPDNVVTLDVSPADIKNMVVCHKENDWGGPIYYSNDEGATWHKAVRNNEGAFMPYNTRWQKFAWHPVDKNKVWALGGDWISSSGYGGMNFKWDANGYTGILVGGMFNFNIQNPDLLYVASQDYNGAFTANGGHSWKYCNASGQGWGGFTYGAYAANDKVLVTQVSEGWHKPGRLTISKNGGSSFIKTSLICNGLQVGSGDAKDPNVIYFSEYYSSDLGETWKMMNGCKGVLTANLYGEKEVYGAHGNYVVKSTDKGETWNQVAELPGSVEDIAVDHTRNRLFIVASGDRLYLYEKESLTNITSLIPSDQYGSRAIRSVAVDPNDPKVVYCAGPKNIYKTDASVKQSTDGGKTWKIITPNNRTYINNEREDGANEVFALRVNPKTRELWCAGGCYGIWKMIPDNKMTIRLTSPVTDSIYMAHSAIKIDAEVSDNVNSISKVEFFNGNLKLGEVTQPPYSLDLADLEYGKYDLYAVVTDAQGNTAYSISVQLKMQASQYPQVRITAPAQNGDFDYLSDLLVTADANDPDGNIVKVEFYNDTIKLGEDTEPPFSFTWQNVSEGTYELTAHATDNTGQKVVSEKVMVHVKDENGFITWIEDFNDGEAQDWVADTGTWNVQLNQFRNSTSDGVETCIYSGSTFANFTFSAKIKSDWNNNFGLIFNYTDSNNYYLLEMDAAPYRAWLKMIKDGQELILADAIYPGKGSGVYQTVDIINNGISTTVMINGNTVFENVATTDFNSGYIGFYTWFNPVWIEDVKVSAKGRIYTSAPLVAADPIDAFRIYPNPVRGSYFNVITRSDIKTPFEFFVYNVEGKLLYSDKILNNHFSVSRLRFRQSGIYIASVISDKVQFRQIFIVE